jgi:hypothetical protein
MLCKTQVLTFWDPPEQLIVLNPVHTIDHKHCIDFFLHKMLMYFLFQPSYGFCSDNFLFLTSHDDLSDVKTCKWFLFPIKILTSYDLINGITINESKQRLFSPKNKSYWMKYRIFEM